LIATTTVASYSDTNIATTSSTTTSSPHLYIVSAVRPFYSYTIAAYDAVGNTSAQSEAFWVPTLSEQPSPLSRLYPAEAATGTQSQSQTQPPIKNQSATSAAALA
jgi:hypothetical protein